MLIVERVLGNTHEDPDLAEECERVAQGGGLEVIRLSSQDVQRGRLRVATDSGTDVGLKLGREASVRDGDVVYRSPSGHRMVVVAVQDAEALVIRPAPGGRPGEALQDPFELGVRLGHVLGNQHWPIRLEMGAVLVPVTTDRKAVETILATYGIDGLIYEFVRVRPDQIPAMTPPIPHDHA